MAKHRRQQRKRGGAVAALSPAPFLAEPVVGGSGAADYAIGVFGNTDAQHPVAGSNVIQMQNPDAAPVPSVTGGARQKGGHGILTDIAVPALLLYANNTFKRRKSYKKLRKSIRKRKSKRYTRGKR